ncbi:MULTISPECIES: 5'/3'-nucleotidase SurE [unclassified Leptolyngbya]|uniref:5'/3'-nucleotidase SurE n=1 Tax=unclassified Leptolyngbya TaxID=2650499 RepID=UPI001685D3D7|nr:MULTISPECIES: 5'/3'-nucleotidase SurE [unclassified Leptolyngbya]MBD1913332.1 5'/3'-nucleotidase SurE [Leptolyngbya sp. FACHB-8]MBD2154488.1 5'/3'-nucleotidase SurE [Leptolyngbya sp. FACHB-16]
MKLLISNDDGIHSLGVQTLANTLADAGHEITVVCPDRERSATGHGLTLHEPIRAQPVTSGFASGIKAWACSGTPSDCVKLALGALLDEFPDLVLSGINHGSNLGTDVLYSGTVSAAMEGVIEGIGGIAFSLCSFTSQDFKPAAEFARTLVKRLEDQPLPRPMLLNVNIPPVPADEIVGVMVTRQGLRRYVDQFEKRVDPRGKTYYWLAGELLEDVPQPPLEFLALAETGLQSDDLNWMAGVATDVQAIRKKYITVTPLQYNLTCASGLASLRDLKLEW